MINVRKIRCRQV